MPVRAKFAGLAIGLPLLALAGAATSQLLTGGADSEYVARAMTAAPPDIAQDATIVRMVNGAMQTVKKGTNEFTCMVANTGPMCMAPIAMEWAHAWQVETAVAKVPVLRVEIVKRSDDMNRFVVVPRRWVVERTFSWFGRNRRLAKDFENLAQTPAAFVTLASIQLAVRRLGRVKS